MGKKLSVLFYFGLIVKFSLGQVPSLQFAFAFDANSSLEADDSIDDISITGSGDLLVGGHFDESIVVSINEEGFILNDEISPFSYSGMFMRYSEDEDLILAHAFAERILFIEEALNEDLHIGGYFYYPTVFDLTGDTSKIFQPFSSAYDAFAASYSPDNSVLWANTFNAQYISSFLHNDNHYYLGSCFDSLMVVSLNDSVTIASSLPPGNNCMMLEFDVNGEIINQFILASEGDDYFIDGSISEALGELAIGGRTNSTLNFQWEGEGDLIIENDSEAPFVAFYNLDHELTSLFIVLNNDIETNKPARGCSVAYDLDGNCYISYTLQQGNYSLNINEFQQDFEVNNPYEIYLVKLDQEKSIKWIRSFATESSRRINNLVLDHNGYAHICGSFRNSIEFPGLGISYSGYSDSGYLARFSPEGETIWAYSIADGGLNEINDIWITSQNEMYIAGWFTSYSTDFDFSENANYDLGLTSYQDPFLAKYSISDPTPDVFIEEGWQITEVTEGGATDNIYIRLSHAPSSSVQVTATPDAQLDLGNGQGVPVTFSFEANSTAVHQQLLSVAAFDDTAVENLHTGVITFNVTSSDSDFDGLIEQPITVNITDNDVISVQETSAIEFSISPNPASEDLQINFSIYQNNIPLQIFDESGKLVKKFSISGTQHRINISDLAVGTYSIVIQNERDKYSQVFIKK